MPNSTIVSADVEALCNAFSPIDASAKTATTTAGLEQLFKATLKQPVNFPPLAESVFPGDRVAVLLQSGIPFPQQTLTALVNAIDSMGIETDNLHVVVSQSTCRELGLVAVDTPADADPEAAKRWELPGDSSSLNFEVHDSEDSRVAYLVANKDGDPVYVNRSLHESDFVIPVNCVVPNAKSGDCLYPEFSNMETRQRFRKKDGTAKQRRLETELANDTLGIFFSIELICAPGQSIHDITCGERKQVRELAAQQVADIWQVAPTAECDMVVTTVETGHGDTTWKDIVTAVVNASRLTSNDGPIVVWSDLSEKPKSKLKQACQAQFEGSISSELPTHLQHFASVLTERSVYLKSKLSGNTIEDLGLGYLESVESVQRIAQGFDHPFLLRDGHLRQIDAVVDEN